MVPTELKLPTYQLGNYNQSDNEEVQRGEHDLVNEKRDRVFVKLVAYKQRVSQHYNKRVKHRSL